MTHKLIYLYFYGPLQLIYINYLNMHIEHINTQSEHATSATNATYIAPNQHNGCLIYRFTPNPLSFNLTHNQPSQFYILTHVFLSKLDFYAHLFTHRPSSFSVFTKGPKNPILLQFSHYFYIT
jgi:hypothetical protein